MKKMTAIFACAMMLSSLSLNAMAAEPFTEASAKALAQKLIPATSTYLSTDNEHDKYEFKFYDETRKESYDIDVSKISQKVTDFESELFDHRGGRTATITQDQAKAAVTNELSGATILSTVLDREDGLVEYEVQFTTETVSGKYTVHPETGAVLQRDIKFQPTATATAITPEAAKKIAQDRAPGATLYKFELDREDGRLVYQGELRKDWTEYEFEIDAATGAILEWDVDWDD